MNKTMKKKIIAAKKKLNWNKNSFLNLSWHELNNHSPFGFATQLVELTEELCYDWYIRHPEYFQSLILQILRFYQEMFQRRFYQKYIERQLLTTQGTAKTTQRTIPFKIKGILTINTSDPKKGRYYQNESFAHWFFQNNGLKHKITDQMTKSHTTATNKKSDTPSGDHNESHSRLTVHQIFFRY